MTTGPLPPDQLFLDNLPLIERIAAFFARKCRFSPQDTEDFASHVKLKLMDGDYRILREFKGKRDAELKTYLGVVIGRLAQDYRNHLWGKFRPSAEAKRLGKVAIRLEQLLYRDRHSFDEACQILQINEGIGMSLKELEELREKLPPRTGGQLPVDAEALENEASSEPQPDEAAEEKEKAELRRRIYAALFRALQRLPAEDRVLVKLRTRFQVSEIARTRGVDAKPLYRRLEKIYKVLRKLLEEEGVRKADVDEILDRLQPDLYAQPKKKG